MYREILVRGGKLDLSLTWLPHLSPLQSVALVLLALRPAWMDDRCITTITLITELQSTAIYIHCRVQQKTVRFKFKVGLGISIRSLFCSELLSLLKNIQHEGAGACSQGSSSAKVLGL